MLLHPSIWRLGLVFSGCILITVGSGSVAARAADIHVENNGVDRSSCGSRSDPCRSISRAIVNGNDGDRILVGPGRYGDLDNDGTFGEAGEEAGDVNGCQCMITVDKQVTILSTDGAGATVLDAGTRAAGGGLAAVRIIVDGVVFGRPGHGFTLLASERNAALHVAGGRTGVVVAGNIASRGAGGFLTGGIDNVIEHNIVAGTDGAGFTIGGTGHTVRDNASLGNGDGFLISGSGHVLTHNASVGNVSGYSLFGDAELFHNSAIGNTDVGIRLEQGAIAPRIQRNNVFGKGDASTQPLTPRANCGLLNRSGRLVSATDNFWGAVDGPGPNPADEICDVGNSVTTVVPFARREFSLK